MAVPLGGFGSNFEVSSPASVVALESSPFSMGVVYTFDSKPNHTFLFLHPDLVHDPAMLACFCFFRPLLHFHRYPFFKNGSTARGTRFE